METISTELLQLGAVAIIFLVCIREFFIYLKQKKIGSPFSNGSGKQILEELQTMNNNHLHEICDKMEAGNARLVNTMHEDSMKIVELLGEINGKLSR
jgi:hypothetical protein